MIISEIARDVSVEPKIESRVRTYVSARAETLVSVVWPSSKAVDKISSVSEIDVLKAVN